MLIECFALYATAAIFFFTVNWKMALSLLAVSPFVFLVIVKFKKAVAPKHAELRERLAGMNTVAKENIVGARITQIFAREDENAKRFEELSNDCRKTWNVAVRYSNPVWPGINTISACVSAAIFIFGLVVWHGSKSFGTIVADHVSFSYEEGTNVLQDVSFTVEPGESVALVGPTGAGKSTIVNLISRFYDLQQGSVSIDGIDVRDVTLHSLRSQMGIMMQDSFIFSETVEAGMRLR